MSCALCGSRSTSTSTSLRCDEQGDEQFYEEESNLSSDYEGHDDAELENPRRMRREKEDDESCRWDSLMAGNRTDLAWLSDTMSRVGDPNGRMVPVAQAELVGKRAKAMSALAREVSKYVDSPPEHRSRGNRRLRCAISQGLLRGQREEQGKSGAAPWCHTACFFRRDPSVSNAVLRGFASLGALDPDKGQKTPQNTRFSSKNGVLPAPKRGGLAPS